VSEALAGTRGSIVSCYVRMGGVGLLLPFKSCTIFANALRALLMIQHSSSLLKRALAAVAPGTSSSDDDLLTWHSVDSRSSSLCLTQGRTAGCSRRRERVKQGLRGRMHEVQQPACVCVPRETLYPRCHWKETKVTHLHCALSIVQLRFLSPLAHICRSERCGQAVPSVFSGTVLCKS